MTRVQLTSLLLFLANLAACQGFGQPQTVGAGARVVNTVPNTTIVSVRYNGQGVSSGGGEGCCVSLPAKWKPGMTATVEWVKDPSPGTNPGGIKAPRWNADGTTPPEWNRWMKIHEANYTRHSVTIPVPSYGETCGLALVFLPCGEVHPVIDCKEHSRIFGGARGQLRVIQERVGGKNTCPKP
ncbi:DUF3304 domain-containing protein [Crenobacter sp. SG2305]|uniref:DUF3304 domain-containing protein n=1 Tax=Crenobacter oryzisoli TaxID=3056844 RepID=UPI0025AB3D9A|nr:DUF3304 domain-containing protein [Crenobacter sp. SG2305]MDN0085597.1 DUF3304 domain-containing protein [Crenobacter sp. SG2305]